MSESFTLAAEKRENFGTGAARAYRRADKVPSVVYGEKENLHIVVEANEVVKLFKKSTLKTTIIDLEIGGKKTQALVKDFSLHPVSDQVEHIDFMFLSKNNQRVEVPVNFINKERCTGVKKGGFFNIVMRSVPVFAAANTIPSTIDVDVNKMRIGDSLRINDITLPEGSVAARKDNFVLASITGRGSKDKSDDESADSTEEA